VHLLGRGIVAQPFLRHLARAVALACHHEALRQREVRVVPGLAKPRALHVTLKGEVLDDEASCIEMIPTGPDRGLGFLFENYRLARISIGAPSKVTTPRGIGIGAGADAVRRAYGRKLKAERHYYEDRPSEYLTLWTVPGKRGVRFETDSKRRVQTIHAGNAAIQLGKTSGKVMLDALIA